MRRRVTVYTCSCLCVYVYICLTLCVCVCLSVIYHCIGNIRRLYAENEKANMQMSMTVSTVCYKHVKLPLYLLCCGQIGHSVLISIAFYGVHIGVCISYRWCGVDLLGLRCCGVRCTRNRPVRSNWKAWEDLTGIILH